MKRKIATAYLCVMVLLSSIAIVGSGNAPEEVAITNDTFGDFQGERALGGIVDPNGPREGPNTRIITPEELLQEYPEPLLAAVDNSAGLPPVGNQGSLASCSAWAIGYYHATYIENQESPFNLTDPNNQVSPGFLYNLANAGYNYGADMNDVADLIISNGACSMAEVPYNESDITSWPDEDWIWVSGMKRKAESKTWLDITRKTGMDALKAYLAAGNTAVTHIQVYSNFDYIQNYNYTYCSSERTGTDRGGHSVAICGFDDALPTADGPGALRMVNSWGTGWGQAGYWWLSYGAVKDSLLCYGYAMYLTSQVNYTPKMVAKANINHAYRGDIVRTYGLNVSVIEGGSTLALKTFLCCPQLEEYLMSYGYPIHQYPFPDGKMAFDISSFISSMNPLANHDFRLSMKNKGSTSGTLVSFEILNAEWWEGGISWQTPLAIAPSSTTLADAWVTPGLFIHMPLRVDGDLDMAHQSIGEFWEGDGSPGSPYIIPGYDINGTGYGYCIYIGNTTDYFVVESCNLHNESGSALPPTLFDGAITLYSSMYGNFINNQLSSNNIGIYLASSSNSTIANNTISLSTLWAINISWSSNISIVNNNISNRHIMTCFANNNIIANNTVFSGGIYLLGSDNNIITGNNVSNGNMGINLYGGASEGTNWNNVITNNTVSSTSFMGIALDNAGNTRVYHNNLINAKGRDFSSNNFWNDTYPSGGNYWSNYTGVDIYFGMGQNMPGSDGMGDTPLIIDADSRDNYPLMSPFDYTEYNVPLQQGWNLISPPIRQLNWSFNSVLESIAGKYDYIRAYNCSDPDSPWESYAPFKPASLNNLDSMNHLRSYWIHMTESGLTLTVKGDKFGSALSIPLKAGWNLVGYPSLVNMTVQDALAGIPWEHVEEANISMPYGLSELGPLGMMISCHGYWVKVSSDCVWTVDW